MQVEQKAFNIYQEYKNPELERYAKKLTEKEYILANVEYQLVNAERNIERLQDVPGKKIADLVAIYITVVNNSEKGFTSYVLSNKCLEAVGISIEELDAAASRNTQRVGFVVKTMSEVILELIEMSDKIAAEMNGGPRIYVLTNSRGINGANILLYKEQLEKVAERIMGDFYILPSSIHELLAIPEEDIDVKYLREMVKTVNDNEVLPEEILGYKIYKYSRKTGEIEVAV